MDKATITKCIEFVRWAEHNRRQILAHWEAFERTATYTKTPAGRLVWDHSKGVHLVDLLATRDETISRLKAIKPGLEEVVSRPECWTERQAPGNDLSTVISIVASMIPAGSGQGDSKTDSRKKNLPDSPDVADLCRLLKLKLPKGHSQIEIALDFTRKDRRKANSLLRQARRFPDLWK